MVTRPEGQASTLADALRAAGAEPLVLPVIEIEDPADGGAALAEASRTSSGYDWLVVTSANGARRVLAGLPDARALGGVSVAAIGPGTAAGSGRGQRPGRPRARPLRGREPARGLPHAARRRRPGPPGPRRRGPRHPARRPPGRGLGRRRGRGLPHRPRPPGRRAARCRGRGRRHHLHLVVDGHPLSRGGRSRPGAADRRLHRPRHRGHRPGGRPHGRPSRPPSTPSPVSYGRSSTTPATLGEPRCPRLRLRRPDPRHRVVGLLDRRRGVVRARHRARAGRLAGDRRHRRARSTGARCSRPTSAGASIGTP